MLYEFHVRVCYACRKTNCPNIDMFRCFNEKKFNAKKYKIPEW